MPYHSAKSFPARNLALFCQASPVIGAQVQADILLLYIEPECWQQMQHDLSPFLASAARVVRTLQYACMYVPSMRTV